MTFYKMPSSRMCGRGYTVGRLNPNWPHLNMPTAKVRNASTDDERSKGCVQAVPRTRQSDFIPDFRYEKELFHTGLVQARACTRITAPHSQRRGLKSQSLIEANPSI
jgi:hypothetical protein